MSLTFIDLFAGIGMFRIGMEKAGHKCIGWVEWDKDARTTYKSMHDTKGEWTENDIRNVAGTRIPAADIWCAG
ncbi:DNA cytosine methyltransferase, partial [Bacillus cereus]